MSKRDFNITLLPESMKDCERHRSLFTPGNKDVLFFGLEGEPNLEANDHFGVTVIIDDQAKSIFTAALLDICPPLLQPASEERFDAHAKVLSKYFKKEVVDQVRSEYFEGIAQKQAWTLYFKKQS